MTMTTGVAALIGDIRRFASPGGHSGHRLRGSERLEEAR